jgi:fibronectin-binding autotransporter adhesin
MKTNSPKSLRMTATALATALLVGSPAIPSARAATVDWAGTSTTWSSGANWSGSVAPVNDLTSDIARFNLASYAALPNAGTTSISGLIFGDGVTGTGALTLAGTALSIGSNGMVMNTNAGAVTVSSGVRLGANQTWTNNSANELTISGAVSNVGNVTPFTLTLAGTGNIKFTGAINNGGTTGTTALVVDKTSGIVTFNGAKAFTGGLLVKSGTVSGDSGVNPFGAGAITLGDSSGSANVTLINGVASVYGALTNPNTIHIAAGSTGTIKIASTQTGAISGEVNLANNLTLSTLSANRLLLSGGVTGTGDITLINESGNAQFEFTTKKLDFDGSITSFSGGNVSIGGGIGSKLKGITNSGKGTVTMKTVGVEVNSAGSTFTVDDTGAIQFEGMVTGTGNLNLVNNSKGTGTSIVGVAGSFFDVAGEIIVSGTSTTAGVTLGAGTSGTAVGTSVKAIRQNSSGRLSVRQGIVVNEHGTTLETTGSGVFSIEGGTTGTGDLILRNNRNTIITGTSGIMIGAITGSLGTLDHVGAIINSGTGLDSVALNYVITSKVTHITQNSATSELLIGGSNSFTGDVNVNAGKITVSNTNAIRNSTLKIASGASASLAGGITIGGLSGAGNVTVGAHASISVGQNNQNTTFSGLITGTNVGLVKVGTGILTLSGTQAVSSVNVNGGSLLINTEVVSGYSATGNGNINVNTAGSFGGIGVVRPTGANKITVAANAYITPGDRTVGGDFGTLVLDGGGTTAALLTMQTNAKFSFRIGEDFESDRIDLWNYAGASDFVRDNNVIEITLVGNVQEGIYNLFNFYEDAGENLVNRGFSSGLSVVFLNGLGDGLAEGNLIFTDYGQINLELTLIPEPSTWTLLMGSLIGAGLYRRRSKLAA